MNDQTIRHVRIIAEDEKSYKVMSSAIKEPLRILKKDLVRPPVLYVEKKQAVPETKVAPIVPVESKKADSVAAVEEPKVKPVEASRWGKFSFGLAGNLALREIANFRTYSVSAHADYVPYTFFSERIRFFTRLQAIHLTSESYSYLFIPVMAGVHIPIWHVNASSYLFTQVALGVGHFTLYRETKDKNLFHACGLVHLGFAWFVTPAISLSAGVGATLVARDLVGRNYLQAQISAVWHFQD